MDTPFQDVDTPEVAIAWVLCLLFTLCLVHLDRLSFSSIVSWVKQAAASLPYAPSPHRNLFLERR